MRHILLLSFFLGILSSQLCADEPWAVLYRGRVRPGPAYAQLWLQDHAGNKTVPKSSAEEVLLLYCSHGPSTIENIPFISIDKAKVKRLLQLPTKQRLFTVQELREGLHSPSALAWKAQNAFARSPEARGIHAQRRDLPMLGPGLQLELKDERLTVRRAAQTGPWAAMDVGSVLWEGPFECNQGIEDELERLSFLLNSLSVPALPSATPYREAIRTAQRESVEPQRLAMFLDEEFSLAERRSRATQILPCLPGKNPGQWHSLACLGMQSYDASSATCTAVANFTAFSEQDFRAMQAHYTALSKLPAFSTAYLERASLLKETLAHAYAHSMAGQRTYASSQKSLHYPPVWRLRLESLYYQLPLTWLALGFYMLAALFCCVYQREHGRAWSRAVLLCTGLGFLTHSAILALRILILARAPVASMYETLVYVPWITMILGMIWWSRQRDFLALLAALLGSILLLALLSITQLDQGLENVQAVLDSQYWLIIHVLMVVGSYGVFLLSALLAHFHLLQKGCNKQLPPLILRTLYIGSALLITGTVLGGIWAAESWGRFWDWDPKESWAFIASCCYITGIHLYTFRKISDLGLALWAGLSFLVITFTWYGVNYILGTGLHSYGFGSGGEAIYYSFILLDSTLLLAGYLRAKRHINLRRQLAGNL